MFPGAKAEEELDGVEVVRRGGRFTVYWEARDYCRRFVDDFDLVKRIKKPDHTIRAFRIIREKFPEARLWILGDGYLGSLSEWHSMG